jgi:hypothetical protein
MNSEFPISAVPAINGDGAQFEPGDLVIVYAGVHYGRLHRVERVGGGRVLAWHPDSEDYVTAHMSECEKVVVIDAETGTNGGGR